VEKNKISRRHFTIATAKLLTGTFILSKIQSQAIDTQNKNISNDRRIHLGGPVFNQYEDPEQLALAHKRLGYSAAYCPNIPLTQTEKIKATESAFSKHGIIISEVGVWCNLMDQDPNKRKQNLSSVIDGLALADAIGARCCVNIAGSFNPQVWFGPHPKNTSKEFFDAAVENARKIIDSVKPSRSVFAYETMGWSIPDSVESYLKLYKAIDRKKFGVHLDPCNLINCPERFYNNTQLLNLCFDKLGPLIVSCHAKDLQWVIEMNVHFQEVVPGKGQLDYSTFLTRLAKLPQKPPLMLEHLSSPEQYNEAKNFIIDLCTKLQIQT
jgi:sugar phosphate isomerase/epimerase